MEKCALGENTALFETHCFYAEKITSCEVDDKHYQYYRYFLYFPFDVLNQYISYHVSAEMIPIIANR